MINDVISIVLRGEASVATDAAIFFLRDRGILTASIGAGTLLESTFSSMYVYGRRQHVRRGSARFPQVPCMPLCGWNGDRVGVGLSPAGDHFE